MINTIGLITLAEKLDRDADSLAEEGMAKQAQYFRGKAEGLRMAVAVVKDAEYNDHPPLT